MLVRGILNDQFSLPHWYMLTDLSCVWTVIEIPSSTPFQLGEKLRRLIHFGVIRHDFIITFVCNVIPSYCFFWMVVKRDAKQ